MVPHDGYSEEAYEEALAGSGGSGKYLNMEDGDDPVTLTIVGRKFVEKLFWTGSTYIPWNQDERTQGDKPAFQLSLNVYDHDMKAVRILRGFTALLIEYENKLETYGTDTGEISNKGKPVKTLERRVFKVSRTGKKQDTRFHFNLWPDTEAPDTSTLTLHDLEAHSKAAQIAAATTPASTGATSGTDDGLPF